MSSDVAQIIRTNTYHTSKVAASHIPIPHFTSHISCIRIASHPTIVRSYKPDKVHTLAVALKRQTRSTAPVCQTAHISPPTHWITPSILPFLPSRLPTTYPYLHY